jgi:hypothetical protein
MFLDFHRGLCYASMTFKPKAQEWIMFCMLVIALKVQPAGLAEG